jgi:two-component system cell cycle sensor histidine kinase/response regulator CckA
MPKAADQPGVDPTSPFPAGADSSGTTDDEARVFKALADNAFFGNVICDSDGIFRYVNRYFAELHGYTPEEMIGRHISLVHTPEQVAVSREIMGTAMREGRAEPQEHGFLHRDGTTFPLLVGVLSVKREGSPGTYVAMSAVDVTPIHKAEVAFQTLFNEMLDGFAHHQIICDDAGKPIDYRYLAANPAFERMTGLNAEELVGRTVREALPGVEQSWIDTFGEVALTGVPARFESFAQALDKHFEVTAFCPAPGEFACIFQDITEGKRANEALHQTQKELLRTQRVAHVGSWKLDPATDVAEWTDELFEIFGVDPAAGTPTFAAQEALFSPASYRALSEAVAHALETGEPYALEVEVPQKDGTLRWAWAYGERVTDAEGRTIGLWGAAQDITERKRTTEALRLSQHELLRVQELAGVGSWTWDFASDVVTWSSKLFEVFGLEPAPVAPTFSEQEALITPATYKALNEAVAGTRVTGIPYEVELEIPRADGPSRWLWARGEPITDADGLTTGLWGAAQDITERKRNAEDRVRLEAHLARAQRLESVGTLAGGVAHDFNNMLTVILGHSERVLSALDPADPTYGEAEEIRRAAERSADMTRQLLAFARSQPVVPRILDLNQAVASVLTMLKRLIGEDIHLVWKPRVHPLRVKIDPSQLDQILTNLCVNARDAIEGVGEVVVEVDEVTVDQDYCLEHPDSLPGEYAQLAVSDNGSGMDPETLSRIFDPFFTTKEFGSGTGLGLATVYGIVRQNEGFLSVYSELGVGTTFRICLPLHAESSEPASEASGPAPKRDPQAIELDGRGSETILLVEDEPGILTLTAKMLEGRGYTVLAAGTPAEAIALAKAHTGKIDLLLTDVTLPEMNGRMLAEALREFRPDLKCLYMSGYTAIALGGSGGLEDGAAFIPKPFHLKDLAAKVREVLGA